jgi:hypothetical protein
MKIYWEKAPLEPRGHSGALGDNLRYNVEYRWVGHTDEGTVYRIIRGPENQFSGGPGDLYYSVTGTEYLGRRPTLAQAKALAQKVEDLSGDPDVCPTCRGTGLRTR